jgi:glycosyltransferase involved in cell wall biosynthesis
MSYREYTDGAIVNQRVSLYIQRMQQPRRIAIVHEWFTSMRGGEKCVEALCEVFPDATLFALVHVKGSVSPLLEQKEIQTSFIQNLPLASTRYRHYLPLFPSAVERFDLREFDCVISSNHCVAKGVHTAPDALHLCYCYTPMRYIWDLYDDYFGPGRAGLLTRVGMRLAVGYLRRWDLRTATNPEHFIAISENVRGRIKAVYDRDSDLIYPPVDTGRFTLSQRDDGYFLVVSALVPYKRVDLAVDACTKSGDRLVVVGDGPEFGRLTARAGPNCEFLGWQSDARVTELLAGCTAVLFPGEEDFGIVPVEAMACGKPVVAYGRGGALETVLDAPGFRTGVLFRRQGVDELVNAMKRVRETGFDAPRLRTFALQFDREQYKRSMLDYVLRRWREFERQGRVPASQGK